MTSISFVKWSRLSTQFFVWSFASLASIPTMISYFLLWRVVINSARYMLIKSRILASSRFCSSRRCHCWIMFVVGPAFFIDVWQAQYADIIVRWLWSRPLIVIYDHQPSPWGSLPEVVIPELNGGRVIITVPPGLYISLQSIFVLEVVEWECRQCLFMVTLNDASVKLFPIRIRLS